MHIPLLCLLGFVVWTVFVVVAIAVVRVGAMLTGTVPAEGFPADTPHGSPRYRRIMRAHLNCVENLPLFAAVVLTGAVARAGSPLLDALAQAYLAARVLQTVVHVASGGGAAIALRFTAFFAQMLCLTGMLLLVAQALFTRLV